MPTNGRLTDLDLAPIASGRLAKANFCAASWNTMNREARSLGVELLPHGSKSSYRSYDQQVYFWNLYVSGQGELAAKPGTSNHGWGFAVDLDTKEMRAMVDRIGKKYGWAKEWSDAPSEWWHIRHRPGIWSGPDPGPFATITIDITVKPTSTSEEDDIMRADFGYNADGRVQIARIQGRENNNSIFHRWMQKDGKWSEWQRIPAASGRTRAWTWVRYVRHPDGRLELFAGTDADAIWRVHQTAPNGGWAKEFVKAT